MTVRKIEFYGYKTSTEPCEISVVFDNALIYSGEITNEQSQLICEHNIIVPAVEIASTDAQIAEIIPLLVTVHSVVVKCTQGSAAVTDVKSPALHEQDVPLVQDPGWFYQTFDEIHTEHNYEHFAEGQSASQDVKYNVQRSCDGIHMNSSMDTHNELGVYHEKVQANERLHFDIMVRNLIDFL
jgi:hypothetical protein